MSQQTTSLKDGQAPERVVSASRKPVSGQARASSARLAAQITHDASAQAYYTARFLVDRGRSGDAYRAYAYFRWVDDWLDQRESALVERLTFVARQQALVDRLLLGEAPDDLTAEERMLADLIASDDAADSGLRSYIRNMMAVMAFDADRRGRLITERELANYALCLATAVTDALHYFIGHDDTPPPSAARYLPAMAAHITHMLRDTFEDAEAGYFNVPRELLESSGIDARDVESAAYRDWVRSRVALARECFGKGADYLDQVKSVRCRLAGYAYMARFTGILDAIEREGYRLRPAYPDASGRRHGLRVAGSVGVRALRPALRGQ